MIKRLLDMIGLTDECMVKKAAAMREIKRLEHTSHDLARTITTWVRRT